jgi:hypothetical protein
VKPLVFVFLVIGPSRLRVHCAAPITGRAMTVPSPVLMLLAELLGLVVLTAGIVVVARRNGGFRLVYARSTR